MSAAASIEAAAAGQLPDWSVAGPARRAHMARVAALLDAWSAELALDPATRTRLRAAAWLHDALRDADPGELRARLESAGRPHDAAGGAGPETDARAAGRAGAVAGGGGPRLPAWPEAADWPAPLLHGPAVAARLAAEGVVDHPLLLAIAYHTTGHPELDLTGRLLYVADFLEPGRSFEPVMRASLRARMPAALDAVLAEVVAVRIRHLVARGHRVRPETVAFWNALAERD